MRTNHLPHEALTWIREMFPPSSFHGFLALGVRNSVTGRFRTIYTTPGERLNELSSAFVLHPNLDIYVTSTMFHTMRREDAVSFATTSLTFDLDCHRDGVSLACIDQYIDVFLEDLKASDLPLPSSVVRTGRGLQLWWRLVPCYTPACRPLLAEIQSWLICRLQSLLAGSILEVDTGASSNLAGFFRLPGSINTKVGRVVTAELWSNHSYTLDELLPLAKAYRPFWPVPGLPSPAPVQPDRLSPSELASLNDVSTLAFFRGRMLIRLRALRNREVGEETRNNLCLVFYSAFARAEGHDRAWKRLLAFNQDFRQPMTEKELQNTICSARKVGGYFYSNEALIRFLGITPEEQVAVGLGSNDHMRARDASRKLQKDSRNAMILDLAQQGVGRLEIARRLDLCPRTVSHVLDEAGLSRQSRDEKILSLAAEGASRKKIASEVGCSARTVSRVLNARKTDEAAPSEPDASAAEQPQAVCSAPAQSLPSGAAPEAQTSASAAASGKPRPSSSRPSSRAVKPRKNRARGSAPGSSPLPGPERPGSGSRSSPQSDTPPGPGISPSWPG